MASRNICLSLFALALALAALAASGLLVVPDRALFDQHDLGGSGLLLLLLLPFSAVFFFPWLALTCWLANNQRRLYPLLVFGAGVGLLAIELCGKLFLVQPAGILPNRLPLLDWNMPYSLPSGHAWRAAFILGLLLPLAPRWLRFLSGLLIASISFILVASGWHFFSDVVVGLALGGGAAALCWWLSPGLANSSDL